MRGQLWSYGYIYQRAFLRDKIEKEKRVRNIDTIEARTSRILQQLHNRSINTKAFTHLQDVFLRTLLLLLETRQDLSCRIKSLTYNAFISFLLCQTFTVKIRRLQYLSLSYGIQLQASSICLKLQSKHNVTHLIKCKILIRLEKITRVKGSIVVSQCGASVDWSRGCPLNPIL